MSKIEELEKIGFDKIGNWFINNQGVLDFEIIPDNTKEVLYSFVKVDKKNVEIIYIGKTIRTISDRLKGYRKPGNSQFTNIRLKNEILNFLQMNINVDIYLFRCNETITYKSCKINLAAGLEDVLIKNFRPTFNLHGNQRILEDVELNDNLIKLTNNLQEENNCLNSYLLKKTARKSDLSGNFNLGTVPDDYLPEYDEIINIYMGEIELQANFINADKNKRMPRINSVAVANWLNENGVNISGNFYIKICNKNSFYFYVIEPKTNF